MSQAKFLRIEAQLSGVLADMQLLVAMTAAVPDTVLGFESVRELIDLARSGTVSNRIRDVSAHLNSILSSSKQASILQKQPELAIMDNPESDDSYKKWADLYLKPQELLVEEAVNAKDRALLQLKNVQAERDIALMKVAQLEYQIKLLSSSSSAVQPAYSSCLPYQQVACKSPIHQVSATESQFTGFAHSVVPDRDRYERAGGRATALQSIASNMQLKPLMIKEPSAATRPQGQAKQPTIQTQLTQDAEQPRDSSLVENDIGEYLHKSDSGFSISRTQSLDSKIRRPLNVAAAEYTGSMSITQSVTSSLLLQAQSVNEYDHHEHIHQSTNEQLTNEQFTDSACGLSGQLNDEQHPEITFNPPMLTRTLASEWATDDWDMDPVQEKSMNGQYMHDGPEESRDAIAKNDGPDQEMPPIPLHREFTIDPSLIEDEDAYNEAIQVQTTGLLNKLTKTNIGDLKPKFLFATKYPSAIRMLGKTLIHRVQLDTHLVELVADLIEYIITSIPLPVMTPISIEQQDQIRTQFQDTVRRIMIYACEIEHADRPKGWAKPLRASRVFALDPTSFEYMRMRDRSLSVARILGELTARKVVTSKVIFGMMHRVLIETNVEGEEIIEEMEFILALINQMGPRMETVFGKEQVDEWFLLLESVGTVLVDDVRVIGRVFGLLALRERKWVEHCFSSVDESCDTGKDDNSGDTEANLDLVPGLVV